MSKTSVLVIGTGFLGGSLLNVLKRNNNYEISATSRQDSHLEKLKELGYKPVKASLDDRDLIVKLVSEHDVVINTASSDHPESVQSTLDGIQKRIDAGKKTVYLHTSGTGVLADNAGGMHTSETVIYDDKPDEIERLLNDGAIHRQVDINILNHAKKWAEKGDLAKIRLMVPPFMFGKGAGPFKDISVQVPSVIRAAKDVKYAPVHGEGKAVTAYIEVNDLAEGYALLLENVLKGTDPKPKSSGDIYYFASSDDQIPWREISARIGEILVSKDYISSAEPKSLPREKQLEHGLTMDKKAWSGTMDYQSVGGNVRTQAVKLRSLGWKPERTSKQQLLDSLDRDVEVVLAE